MRYQVDYTITGDNASHGTYITDNVSEFVPRMRNEYAGRITFSIRQLANPDGSSSTVTPHPSGEDHTKEAE